MKYVQVIDGADNCVYDVFASTDEDHAVLFPDGTDVAFAEELDQRTDSAEVAAALERLWLHRVPKARANGIHGLIFFGLMRKRQYYPSRRDEEAVNPDGTRLRK